MKRQKLKFLAVATVLLMTMLCGCSHGATNTTTTAQTTNAPVTTTVAETTKTTEAETTKATEKETTVESTNTETSDDTVIHIGSLKGPTSMGLVSLISAPKDNYDFQMVTAADELTAGLINGTYDIVTVPANLASILYNRTNQGVSVVNINTLGVLYLVASDPRIESIEDLGGETIYMTGKGSTPEYVFENLLVSYGLSLDDVTLEFRSEPSEVAAILKENPDAIAVLPEPFVSVALNANPNLYRCLSLSEWWDYMDVESTVVTGVTVVRNEFLEEHKDLVDQFLKDYRSSVNTVLEDSDLAAQLIGQLGIVSAEIAKLSFPYCNIAYIDGAVMKTQLQGFLSVLFEANPESIGGTLPEDNFYYEGSR